MYLHLVYVNENYRNNNVGKKLLSIFLNIQKRNGIASIYTSLPKRYVSGINFLKKNNFCQKEKIKSKIILEFKLWDDYGIGNSQIIGDTYKDMFS